MSDPYDYTALKQSALASVRTASSLGIALNGTVPFSVDAWVKFDGLCAGAGILSQSDSFTFGIIGDSLALQIPGYPMATSSPRVQPLQEGGWQYVCVTYQAGQVRFYIDGQFNSFTSVAGNGSTNANPFLIGNELQSEIRGVRVYNLALDPDTVLDNMYNPPAASTIVADFDFTQSPPVDNGGGHLPITLSGGARMITYTPALGMGGTAFAQPLRDEEVNPGGAQVDPYTVQSSIYISSDEVPLQAIFVNSDLAGDSGMSLYLAYDETVSAFRAVSVRGSNNVARNALVSTGTVPLNRWVNVATTFDGTTLSLYLNGALDSSGPFGPIAQSRNDGLPLVGAAYVDGQPSGGTSLQGFISDVEVWRVALDAAQIAAFVDTYPDPQLPDLAALYDFSSYAPANLVNGHPVALAAGAAIASQTSTAIPGSKETKPESAERYEQLDAATIEEIRRSIDFSAEVERLAGDFARVTAADIAAAGADRERAERIRKAWNDTIEKLRRDPLSLPFLVTRHRINGEDILLSHTRRGTEVVYRAAAGSVDDCLLWKVQLVFVIVAGILDAVFGLSARLSPKAITYIINILRNPRLAVILAAGTAITGPQMVEAAVALYKQGYLKILISLLLDVGFWTIVRVVTKLVLTLLGVGYVDLIASLTATIATFILVWSQRPSACDPPPNVEIAAIKFDYDPTNSAIEALTIRRDYRNDVPVPEWVKGKTLPADSPAAYSIAKVSGKTITIQARFTITTRDAATATISASGGGILGAIPSFTVNFRNGVSVPEYVTIAVPNHRIASNGVQVQNIQWAWSYSIASGPSGSMATTSHRIYSVLTVPNGPWTQSGRSDTQLPWTDVLDYACVWAAGTTSAGAAATAVTQKVYGTIGLTYDQRNGASAYTANNSQSFLCTMFVDYLRTGRGKGNKVNCTDCAAIVSAFANILGCNLASSTMYPASSGGFATNQMIAIGGTTWGYPFPGTPSQGVFSYHEVAWLGALSYTDPLNDACLQVDGGNNPWNWSTPPVSPHIADLPDPMQFTTQGISPSLPIATPFTSSSYRERLCTNNADGINACVPQGPWPLTNGGRRRNQ